MTTEGRPPFDPHDWTDPEGHQVTILPTDYDGYGGGVARWAKPDGAYPDCSCGCVWFDTAAAHAYDWGICRRPGAPREGLMTWEHMAGYNCFEGIEELAERVRTLMTQEEQDE